jgi:hypothetical protein
MDLSAQMFKDIPKVVYHHWKNGNINWPMCIFTLFTHSVALAGIFALPKADYRTLLWAFILWPIRFVYVSGVRV